MADGVYFVTFRTYGTWLHGDSRGSVDRHHRDPGEPLVGRDDGLLRRRKAAMKNVPFLLDSPARRQTVEAAIRDTCSHRGWHLTALNVRTNHVHAVVVAGLAKERVLSDLKARATRRLRETGLASEFDQVWAHHGSTRVLDTEAAVEAAVQYVLFEQGSALG